MGITSISSGGLFTVLATDRTIYAPNRPVQISLFKLNISARPITLTYPTSQRYEFTVSSPFGVIWRWSNGRVFLPVVETVTLYPGQSLAFSVLWPRLDSNGNPVPPGFYRVTGWNTAAETSLIRPSVFIRLG